MKKTNRAIIITMTMAIAIATTPYGNVFAATAPSWENNNSSATLVRQITNAYGTINNTFSYTITADADNPAGATGAPDHADIIFNETYTTQGTASKSTSLDFSNMQFSVAGNYYYTITESSSSPNASIYPVSSNSYKALITVSNNDALTGYVAKLYIKENNAEGNKLTDISGDDSQFIFATSPVYTNIQVLHTVSGNAADPNRCFSYTFSVSTNDSYALSVDSACENESVIKNGDTIKLKHKDIATIGLVRAGSQIPIGTTYSFTKVGTDEYTTSMDGIKQTNTGSKTAVVLDSPAYNTANKTTIDENLDTTVDTGVAMNIAAYVFLAIAGAAGIYFATRRKGDKEA